LMTSVSLSTIGLEIVCAAVPPTLSAALPAATSSVSVFVPPIV